MLNSDTLDIWIRELEKSDLSPELQEFLDVLYDALDQAQEDEHYDELARLEDEYLREEQEEYEQELFDEGLEAIQREEQDAVASFEPVDSFENFVEEFEGLDNGSEFIEHAPDETTGFIKASAEEVRGYDKIATLVETHTFNLYRIPIDEEWEIVSVNTENSYKQVGYPQQ